MLNPGKPTPLENKLFKEEVDKLTEITQDILKCLEARESSMVQDCAAALSAADFLLRQMITEPENLGIADALRTQIALFTFSLVEFRKSQITESN